MKVQIVANEVMERTMPGIQAAIQERVESQTGALLADKAGKAVEAAMEKRLVSTEGSVASLSAKVDSLKTSMLDKFKSLKTSMADKSRQQELMMHNIDDDASTRIVAVLERLGDVEGRAASLSLALVSKVLFSDVGINLFVSLTIVYSLSLLYNLAKHHSDCSGGEYDGQRSERDGHRRSSDGKRSDRDGGACHSEPGGSDQAYRGRARSEARQGP